MPPYVNHLVRAILWWVEDPLERVCLICGVPRRLVPIRLRICKIDRFGRDVQVAGPDYGLLFVEGVEVLVEVFVPGILL